MGRLAALTTSRSTHIILCVPHIPAMFNMPVTPVPIQDLSKVIRRLPPQTDYSIVTPSNAGCTVCLLRASAPSCMNGPPNVVITVVSSGQPFSRVALEGLDSDQFPDKNHWVKRILPDCIHNRSVVLATGKSSSLRRASSVSSETTLVGEKWQNTASPRFKPYATSLQRAASTVAQPTTASKGLRRAATASDVLQLERREGQRMTNSSIGSASFKLPLPSGPTLVRSATPTLYAVWKAEFSAYLLGNGPMPSTPAELEHYLNGANEEELEAIVDDKSFASKEYLSDMFATYQRNQIQNFSLSLPDETHDVELEQFLALHGPPSPPAEADITASDETNWPTYEEMQEWLRLLGSETRGPVRASDAPKGGATLIRTTSLLRQSFVAYSESQ